MTIVLIPKAPTVGGYPVPAVLASVDRPVSVRSRPGDRVRSEWVSVAEARNHAANRATQLEMLAGSEC